VPRVTGLTSEPAGTHVGVELDGAPWRRIPLEVAVRAGITADKELERADLRRLRRELRRAEALDIAARALRHRDRSRGALSARLAAARIPPWAREQALETLAQAGIVDDGRFAVGRAQALASRGCGDALIRAELAGAQVAELDVRAAVDSLEPERERAIELARVRGQSLATARWLARKGFDEESIEAALPALVADWS
jgi:SOS response regulatory protein OraA/RecX